MVILVNIDVDNLEVAIRFYQDAFGLRPARRFGDSGAQLIDGSNTLYLLERAACSSAIVGGTARRSYQRHWTPVHLDFVVDDVVSAVRRAQAAGAVLEGQVESHAWGRIAHCADPFGHGFCLIQFMGRGYDEVADGQTGAAGVDRGATAG